MKFVTSRENGTLKHIHKLVKQKKYRNKNKQFVAEGLRTCQDVLISNIHIDVLLCSENFYTRNLELCNRLESISDESIVVPNNIFNVLSDTKSPQGVMLVLKTLDKTDDIDKIDLRNAKNVLIKEVLQSKVNVLLNKYIDAHKEELLKMFADLTLAARIEEFKVFVVDYHSKYAIYGFVPVRVAKDIKKAFEKYNVEYQDLPAHIYDDQQIIAPTLTNNYPWAKPFEVISKVKQSDHVDTTLATAVLFILVFALMLGDIGLGVVLVLLGLLMRKKDSGKMITILGIASFVGGLLYGDAFYSIHLYNSVIPVADAFSYQRFINAILLLIVGQFCIGKVKAIYNEQSMINKVFSIKGAVGIVMGLTVFAYVAIAVDTTWHVSYLPLVVLLVLGIVLNFIKKALDKKQ